MINVKIFKRGKKMLSDTDRDQNIEIMSEIYLNISLSETEFKGEVPHPS